MATYIVYTRLTAWQELCQRGNNYDSIMLAWLDLCKNYGGGLVKSDTIELPLFSMKLGNSPLQLSTQITKSASTDAQQVHSRTKFEISWDPSLILFHDKLK